MMRLVIGCLAMTMATLPALADLKAGDPAPQFAALASLAGKSFHYSLKQALKKGPVVVYFYPSSFTGGCNIQAHTFAVNSDQFKSSGATIIGVSLDSIERLNDFSKDPEYCAGKFPTASDADGKIARSYDLKVADARPGLKDTRGVDIDHGFAERTTFVVTPDGKIADTIGGLAPAENVERALASVRALRAGK
jgi:peroxiredoxin Q/BCP